MGKLFGTDGIRGAANEYPLISEVALDVGRAVVSIFKGKKGRPKIVIGKDTRISGFMIEYALASGICSMGGDVCLAGVLPTPAIAFLTSSMNANAGIMISASHNPFSDNGIKIFNSDGYKLADGIEAEIEKAVLNDAVSHRSRAVRDIGSVIHLTEAQRKYREFLKACARKDLPFRGLKMVLDCSNGATYMAAPELFSELGAAVESMSVQPDGKNINAHCGSEHPQALIKAVLERKADIGLAFDGDGDRLIAVDEKGRVVTGDRVLAICAKVFKKTGRLKNNLVVSTVMSNVGLRIALKEMGIRHLITKVGDRYVLAQMIVSGAVIGGEDSGHMIFLNHHTTGDGILTAIKLIEAMQTESKPLSELGAVMKVFPQVLISVTVRQKPEIQRVPEIVEVIQSIEEKLGEEGRVLVRYSGTQPLCRVMVEGPDKEKTRQYSRLIADVVRKKLGS
jgi:phosphoglucosamine mutase